MARPQREIDRERYATLVQQGLSTRQIARELGIPQSTLQQIVKRLPSPPADVGIREGDIGIPEEGVGIPEGDNGIPQRGSAEVLPHHGQGIPEVSQSIPKVASGLPEVSSGPPLQELHALWPTLTAMATWWQDRQRVAQEPEEKLERATFHLAPRLVQAIRREADKTGESYAAVANRALRWYFQGREP